MRVILADDQPSVCSAVKLMLEEKPGMEVIAETNNTPDLILQTRALHPDLIFLDWELPGGDSREVISHLRTVCPRLLVIALSSSPQERSTALKMGANEFVCKSDPPESLLKALDSCCGEHNY